MKTTVRIIITEDKQAWRQAVRNALKEYNIITIAEAGNGIELLQHLETHTPDIILLDLNMPVMSGCETMRWLNEKYPDKKVIILSFHDDPILMEDYVMRGASGYFSKDEVAGNIERLAAAIKKIHKGGRYVTHLNENENGELKKLSIRQKEIISLAAEGKTSKEIAARLKLTVSAVEKQKKKIMDILEVNNQAEFYSSIFERGLNHLYRNRKAG